MVGRFLDLLLTSKHVQLLERDQLAPGPASQVTDLEGKQRILDLMLYQQYPQRDPDHFEHLVVELKRPNCKLGKDEISQIEEYAFAVANDERFDKTRIRWNFLLVGNELTPFAKTKCGVQGKEFGHIFESDDKALNIYVRTWSGARTWERQAQSSDRSAVRSFCRPRAALFARLPDSACREFRSRADAVSSTMSHTSVELVPGQKIHELREDQLTRMHTPSSTSRKYHPGIDSGPSSWNRARS